MNTFSVRQSSCRKGMKFVLAGLLGISPAFLLAADPPPVKAPVKAPPAAQHVPSQVPHSVAPAAGGHAAPGHAAAPGAAGRPAAPNVPGRGATTPAGAGRAQPSGGGAGAAGRQNGIPGRAPGIAGHAPTGRMETGRNGTQFQRGGNGQVSTIRHGDMTIRRGPGGSFRSERTRPDGSRLVAHRSGGYVEHGYRYGGHDVYRRNYYYRGAYYSRYYNPYVYRGISLNVYAPAYYYGPGFYGYVYAPWATPVAYSWGFAGNPWYGYYGGYFTPYPVYASPSLWLTDYLVSQSLQQAYQDRMAGNGPGAADGLAGNDQQQIASAPAPMTPVVKQAIANEVRAQIALENSERQSAASNAMPDPASSGIARILGDNTTHVFVASAALTLQSAGQECAVTEGDVLQLNPGQQPNGTEAAAVVLSSKGSDCAKGSQVSIAYADLQDMQNHMRATIDMGMGELQKKQGQNGIPAMPPSAVAPPVEASYAKVAPPPDPGEAAEVVRETQDATQAEQDALNGSLSGPQESSAISAPPALPSGNSSSPAAVDIGQTFDQVEAIMGKPKSIAKGAAAKTIYIYPNLKIIFSAGKVTDIQ